MRSPFTILASIPALAFVLASLQPAIAESQNGTLSARHWGSSGGSGSSSSSYTTETCATVAGAYRGFKFNFGCLCESDVDDYCANNGINSYIKDLLNSYVRATSCDAARCLPTDSQISQHGTSHQYPSNAQPTCDGYGGYACGTLAKQSDGSCATTTCPRTYVSSNGGCCPRGQTYSNGKCCGSTGCSRSSHRTCTPALTCSTYSSNDICCPAGTSGWTGYDTVCCPSGQTESNGACVCPSSQQKDPSNSNACVSKCQSGHSWCTSRCCPSGQIEVNGACACPSGQQFAHKDSSKCVAKCSSGSSWCSTRCCPTGAEERQGVCVCTDASQKLSTDEASCIDRCSSDQRYNSQTGNCDSVCDTHAGYSYQTSSTGAGLCCASSHRACRTTCCPANTDEVGSTGVCCAAGSSVVNGQCISPSHRAGRTNRRRLSEFSLVEIDANADTLDVVAADSYYGVAANADRHLCPSGAAACPVPGMSAYECLDVQTDLQSCGGCASMGQGVDCTAIRGARYMGCNRGQCEVYSCRDGWSLAQNGTACVHNGRYSGASSHV